MIKEDLEDTKNVEKLQVKLKCDKEGHSSINSKPYEILGREYLNQMFSTYLQNCESKRKIPKQYEWDSVLMALKNFSYAEFVGNLKKQFDSSFEIINCDENEQFRAEEWLFVEIKLDLSNYLRKLSDMHPPMNIYDKFQTKIERFCDFQLEKKAYPNFCHVFVFSASKQNLLYPFRKLVKCGGLEF